METGYNAFKKGIENARHRETLVDAFNNIIRLHMNDAITTNELIALSYIFRRRYIELGEPR